MDMIERKIGDAGRDCLGSAKPPGWNGVLNGTKNIIEGGSLIESYSPGAEGYHPFLIRDGWQVAQLNYMPRLRMSAIRQMDRHQATDEVFIPVTGTSVLIAAEETPVGMRFVATRMRSGVTYNIPAGRWHNITMRRGDSVIIVEKSLTHCRDVDYRELTSAERRELREVVRRARGGGQA